VISQAEATYMVTELEITVLFTVLFLAQTAIFTYLLLRLKKRVEKSYVESRTSQDIREDLDEGKLSESILKALSILSTSSLSAREVSVNLGLSREHTARLLKKMVEAGLVVREGKPYRYRATPSGKSLLNSVRKTSD